MLSEEMPPETKSPHTSAFYFLVLIISLLWFGALMNGSPAWMVQMAMLPCCAMHTGCMSQIRNQENWVNIFTMKLLP